MTTKTSQAWAIELQGQVDGSSLAGRYFFYKSTDMIPVCLSGIRTALFRTRALARAAKKGLMINVRVVKVQLEIRVLD